MKKLFGILMLLLLFSSPVTVLARGGHGGHGGMVVTADTDIAMVIHHTHQNHLVLVNHHQNHLVLVNHHQNHLVLANHLGLENHLLNHPVIIIYQAHQCIRGRIYHKQLQLRLSITDFYIQL